MTALIEHTIAHRYKKNPYQRNHPLDAWIMPSSASEVSSTLPLDCFLAFEKQSERILQNDPLAYSDKLREFFLLNVVCPYAQWPTSTQQLYKKLLAVEKWNSTQLVSALKAVNTFLSHEKIPSLTPSIYPSGAAPFDAPAYWPAGELPHHSTHAELALLWAFLGIQTKNQSLIDGATKVAQWQLNFAVDHQGAPLNGLFTQESEGTATSLALTNYLLFKLLGNRGNALHFLTAADKQATFLDQHFAGEIPAYLIPLEKWVETTIQGSRNELHAPFSPIEIDLDCGVIIRREEAKTLYCTLAGSNSGVGGYIGKGVQIVNFGPQHLPFGESDRFGLEQSPSALFRRQMKKSEGTDAGFHCQGKVKLTTKEGASSSFFRRREQSGHWMDLLLDYQKEILTIQSTLMGFHSIEGIAFVFYVKAKSCRVGEDKCINRRSLQHFQGVSQPLTFEGEGSSLVIEPQQAGGEMKVIPLGGKGSFWDADYLIGFPFKKEVPKVAWRLFEFTCIHK